MRIDQISVKSNDGGRRLRDLYDNNGNSADIGVYEKRKKKTKKLLTSTKQQRLSGIMNGDRGDEIGDSSSNNEDQDPGENFLCRVSTHTVATFLIPINGLKLLYTKSLGMMGSPGTTA